MVPTGTAGQILLQWDDVGLLPSHLTIYTATANFFFEWLYHKGQCLERTRCSVASSSKHARCVVDDYIILHKFRYFSAFDFLDLLHSKTSKNFLVVSSKMSPA